MEVRHVQEVSVSGYSTVTNNAAEMSPDKGKIPALWQKFDAEVPVDYRGGERVYGVYYDYESDHTGDFTVLAGFDGSVDKANTKIETITVPAGKYLVFSCTGDMPQIAIDAWTQVWQYFSQTSTEYQRLFTVDFEHYPNGNAIDVYIAIA
jgi:predicted transcriptional regulator YdeE